MRTRDLVAMLLSDDAPGSRTSWADVPGTPVSTRLDLRVQVDALTRTYRIQGIGPGSTVVVHMRPSYTFVWTVLALWNLDTQVLLLDPHDDAAAILDRWKPQFLIRSGVYGPRESGFVQECEVVVYPCPGSMAARTDHCLVQVIGNRGKTARLVGRNVAGLLDELRRLKAQPGAPRPKERVLLAAPLVHPMWMVSGVLYTLFTGATLVLPHTRAQVNREIVADVLFSTPAGLQDVWERLIRSPVRLAVIAGGFVSAHDAGRFRRHFGTALGRMHQTAEAGVVAGDLTGRYSPPAVGPALDGVRLQVRHRELLVQLDTPPDLDAVAGPAPRWWRTGDTASISSNGSLVIHPAECTEPVTASLA